MRKLSVVLALIAVGLIATGAHATTYYVSTTGSDNDDGSSESPWATLQHAVDTISAGDTILVNAGTYDGCRIRYSGSSGSPKILCANGAVLINDEGALNRRGSNIEIQHDDYESAVDYWEIDGFEVSGATGWGIDAINAGHLTVTNCEVHNCGTTTGKTGIFSAYGDYVLIEDNISYSNGEHGIYCNNSPDYGDIKDNVCYSNVGNGIHMNGDESMGGDGIMSYWEVDYNTCYSNGANGINCDGVTDSKFRNNLIYDTGSKGFSMYAINGAVTSKNNMILNNTVVNPDGSYYCIFIHRNRRPKGDPTGMRIYNNILYHYSTATNRGSICVHDSAFSDFDSDYNAVMEYFGINDNRSQDTFSEWQTRGYDTNSIQETAAQLFDDATNDDYHLDDNSGAVDGGTTLTDVSDDIDGVSRPQGSAYDIGCYED